MDKDKDFKALSQKMLHGGQIFSGVAKRLHIPIGFSIGKKDDFLPSDKLAAMHVDTW